MDSKTARIRALNDELRQNFAGGAAVMTPGIAALGAEAVTRIGGMTTAVRIGEYSCGSRQRISRPTPALQRAWPQRVSGGGRRHCRAKR
jgi:hypothetical protein